MAIKHLVLLKFREGFPASQINVYFQQLANLKQYIAGFLSFKSINNISQNNLDQGFKHGFEIEFADEQSLNNYLNHELHLQIANEIIQNVQNFPEGVLEFDYRA